MTTVDSKQCGRVPIADSPFGSVSVWTANSDMLPPIVLRMHVQGADMSLWMSREEARMLKLFLMDAIKSTEPVVAEGKPCSTECKGDEA